MEAKVTAPELVEKARASDSRIEVEYDKSTFDYLKSVAANYVAGRNHEFSGLHWRIGMRRGANDWDCKVCRDCGIVAAPATAENATPFRYADGSIGPFMYYEKSGGKGFARAELCVCVRSRLG